MSIAKSLPSTEPFFIQHCPLCGNPHRMMIRGNYVKNDKWERYPDIGYSFCNCRNIFYTKWENVKDHYGWNGLKDPVYELRRDFYELNSGQTMTISMYDPYFINWSAPHEMNHWLVRKNHILWDMESFAEECKRAGFEVVSMARDMDLDSKT